jgi:glycogen operon protein
MRNAAAMLVMSQGVPMILMGDEVARTQYGNNNTYCHDNELNWMDWMLAETNSDLLRFYQKLISFRHAHAVLRNRWHLSNRDLVGSGYADITWHGTQAWNADWSPSSRILAFMLCGKHARGGTAQDNYIYVAMNMHWESHWFELPGLPDNFSWYLFANTSMPAPLDICDPGEEIELDDQRLFLVGGRSVSILVGK